MERLHKAIREWEEAYKAHEQALGDYQGYSWGWAGAEYIDRLDKAKQKFNDALDELINERVEQKLAEKRSNRF